MKKFAIGVACTLGAVVVSNVSYRLGYIKGVFDTSVNYFFDDIEEENEEVVQVIDEEEES